MYQCIYTYYQQTQRGPTGWSEAFWNNNSSSAEALSEALSLGVLLRNVHSKNALMQGVSVRFVSDNPAQKSGRRVSFVAINETLASASGRLTGMYPTTALRLNVVDAEGRSNYNFLKGMPDGIDTEGSYTAPIAFIIPINQLLAELHSPTTGWARRRLVETNPKRPITDMTAGGLVTCPAHTFVAGMRVRIGKTISTPNVDKVYRVLNAPTADTFNIVGMPPVAADPTITAESYAQLQYYEGVIITSATVNAVTKKNVGRPSGAPAGRQKTPKN